MTNKPISEVIAEVKATTELIERGYRQTWGCEDSDDCIHVGTFNEDGDLCPFIEASISNWSGDEKDNENLAAFLVAANPVNVKRLIDHIAALEQQLAAERARSKWSTGEPPDFGWYYVRYEQEIQGKSSGKFYFSRAQYLQYDPCAPSDRRIKEWVPEYARSMNGIKVTHWISLPDFIEDRIPVEGE
ncbi:hypothetical protein [Pectobacterium aroidearum]|uniref:hypothetical protein n=1 Tax=Pectobacterium aroidearum TaxID=1201031 RepID=UPI003016EB80